MLPLPYAPNIDVDAERLRMAREKGAQPTPDVGAGISQGITTGLTLKSALDAENSKAAAEAFQRDYLDKGNEGIAKMYEEAGSPKDFQIGFYQIPQGTPPDKARDMVLLAAKDLTGYREKQKTEKIGADTAAAALAGKTPVEVAAVSQDPKLIADATAKAAENTAKALDKADERALRDQIKKDDRAWDKTLATFKAGLERDTKAGKATVQIVDDLSTLTDLASKRAEYSGKKRLTDTDKIEYADVVRQMSIVNERIAKAKRDGAVTPKADAPTPQPAPSARPRATNPKTGEIVEWDGKAWLPVKK